MVKESFYLHTDAETIITISIEGKHRDYIADRIRFDLPYHQIFKCLPDKNIQTYKIMYFVKRKPNDEEDEDG